MGLKEIMKRVRGGGPEPEPAAPYTLNVEPCAATCLGNALMAYWLTGKSWGSANLIGWMLQEDRMSVYAHVARDALRVIESSAVTDDKDFWREVGRLKRKLARFEGSEPSPRIPQQRAIDVRYP